MGQYNVQFYPAFQELTGRLSTIPFMRLEKIKLAGFKSFVDPTTLVFPGRLIGVVGPNGCGKSNIIDAVRFVIGESSARHLRGSAMADVVFNGSSTRKPVSLASVELIFDNSEGRLGGEYARYAQIALKRQVTCESQSLYFLNGTRCRRRDLMDVLLGTGLGPRSYAIIEQGTVSRFVEARPDELRLFVEEAAGLSRYKERRHETELKLQQVRANLERVQDIRGELESQVKRLSKQARKAEKYRELTRSIEQCQRELLALQWRRAESEHRHHQARLNQLENDLITRETALRQAEQRVAEARTGTGNLTQRLQSQQAQLYELNAAISQCDQALRHAQKTLEERGRSLDAWRAELCHSQEAMAETRAQLASLDRERRRLQAELDQSQTRITQIQARHRTEEARWQKLEREFNREREAERRLEAEIGLLKVEIHHSERHLGQARAQLEQLTQERRQLEQDLDPGNIDDLSRRLAETEALRTDQLKAIETATREVQQLEAQKRELGHQMGELETEHNRLQGRLSALETLQRHALGKDRDRLTRWLESLDLQDAPRLAETLETAAGWETAVETALADWLEAVCLEQPPPLDRVTGLTENAVFFVRAAAGRARGSEAEPRFSESGDALTAKLRGDWHPSTLLCGFRCVDTLDEALDRRGELAECERWITPTGDQVGPDWIRLHRQRESNQGVLERQKALRELRSRLEALTQRRDREQAGLERLAARIRATEEHLEALRLRERDSHHQHSRLQAELSAARARGMEIRQRLERLAQTCQRLELECRTLSDQLHAQRRELAQKTQASTTRAETLAHLEGDLNRARADFDRTEAETRHHLSQQTKLQTALERSEHASQLLLQQLRRAEHHRDQLRERLQQAEAEQDEGKAPIERARRELETLLARRTPLETDLAQTRTALQRAEAGLREQMDRCRRLETAHEQARHLLEKARLDAEAARIRWQTAGEQVATGAVDLPRILASLPETADIQTWQQRLERLRAEQAGLGDVNLTAIEEHRQHAERLRFLDKQCTDLETSLEMLGKAIRKIDRESRNCFRTTFEAVDTRFRERFPALFGGGEAWLELTGEDPLDAGIRIVARPPGKRNSSIHLLSGGEKALTAIALVFSFFELNPAPVCLLDEVDAPLDEANVGRFCQLLQTMSERVQFIFVTHNKTTMEIADQLIGVTMREPGVSHIVAVDLKQAADMAAA